MRYFILIKWAKLNSINNFSSERNNFLKFSYLGIFEEIEKLAKEHFNFLNLSKCDPPLYGFKLDDTIIKKIDQLKISQYTRYPSWNGSESLRKNLSQRIYKICNTNIPPDNIIMTNGVSECFPLTFDALFYQNPGSVAIPDPSYIPLIIQARRFGKFWFYPCVEEDDWNPDIDQIIVSLEKHQDTKAIVIITPNAPTGAIYSEKILKELINIAGQYNLIIITDEIYDSISFESFQSPLELAHDIPVIYLNGFSKVYRLPGYRLGYLGWYDPLEQFPHVWNYLKHLCKGRFGVTLIAQEIAKLALQEPEETLNAYVKSVQKKQDFLTEHLKTIEGISIVPARGATYVFPKINFDINDEDVAKYLIKHHGIIAYPGSAYGPTFSPNHLRFVTLAPEKDLLKGIHALKETLEILK